MQVVHFRDELRRKCLSCGNILIPVGYWDKGLDFYIYFEEKLSCNAFLRKSAFFYEKIKNFTEGKWKDGIKI